LALKSIVVALDAARLGDGAATTDAAGPREAAAGDGVASEGLLAGEATATTLLLETAPDP